MPGIYSYDYNGRGNDAKITPDFLDSESLTEFFLQDQLVCGEIHAESYHKYSGYDLAVCAVASHTVVFDAEASCSRRSESDAQCVEQRHSSNKKEDDLHDSHSEINSIQDFGRRLHFGNQFAYRRSGTFRPHQVHMITACKGKKGEQEYQNSHASDPVSEASPENNAFRKDLHIRKNAGAGGCEAGYSFKYGVDGMGDTSAYNEGQRSGNTENDPA